MCTHCIVSVRPDKLECRAVHQFDEHVVVLHPLDDGLGEGFENAALSGVAVHAVPNGLARLLLLRKAVPIGAGVLECQRPHGV
jgi:hypothetical protein